MLSTIWWNHRFVDLVRFTRIFASTFCILEIWRTPIFHASCACGWHDYTSYMFVNVRHIFLSSTWMFRCQHRHAVIKDVNLYRCKLKQTSSILPQFCAHFWRFRDTCQEIYFQVLGFIMYVHLQLMPTQYISGIIIFRHISMQFIIWKREV